MWDEGVERDANAQRETTCAFQPIRARAPKGTLVKPRLQPPKQPAGAETGSVIDQIAKPLERVPSLVSIVRVLPSLITSFGRTKPIKGFPDFVVSFSPVVGFLCCFALVVGGPSGRFVAKLTAIHLLVGLVLGALHFLCHSEKGGASGTDEGH